MKKMLGGCFAFVLFLLMLMGNAFASENVTVYVNETSLDCEPAPYVENGRTMVPMRKIFEALDAVVLWEGEEQKITATKETIEIILQINNPIIYVNGEAQGLDVAPVIVGDTTFVPIRAVSQSLQASVEWFEQTQSVYINSPVAYETAKNTPVTLMYAADGRTLYVPQSEVEAYQRVGWYATYEEAQAANAPSYSSPDDVNMPNSGGSSVYRTPKGKRYHFDPDCGGKNSYPTTMEEAKNAGLTPCKKCAY